MSEELSIPISASVGGSSLPAGSDGNTIIYEEGEWVAKQQPQTLKNLRVITVNPDEESGYDNTESIGLAILAANAEFDAMVDSQKVSGTVQGGEVDQVFLESSASDEDGYYIGWIIKFYEGTGAEYEGKIVDYSAENRFATIYPPADAFDTTTKYHIYNYNLPRKQRIVIAPGEYYEDLQLSRNIHISAANRGTVVIYGNHLVTGSCILENVTLQSESDSSLLYTATEWHPYDSSGLITLNNCDLINNNIYPALYLPDLVPHYNTQLNITVTLNHSTLTAINGISIKIGAVDIGDGIYTPVPHQVVLKDTAVSGRISLLSTTRRGIDMTGGSMRGELQCYYASIDTEFLAASFTNVSTWNFADEQQYAITFKNNYIATLDPPTTNQNNHVILRNVNFYLPDEYSSPTYSFIDSDENLTGNVVKFRNVCVGSEEDIIGSVVNTIGSAVTALKEPEPHQEILVTEGTIPSNAQHVGLQGETAIDIGFGLYDGQRITIIKRDGFVKNLFGNFAPNDLIIFEAQGGSVTLEWSADYEYWAVICIFNATALID